ncbi:GNAT family N-acetyltransferase [Calothrix rhizosoleniae]|uniref:GNAT family N-acetyltransferase n=1 Tax=Calothrix rhizosoleniae TaxID=888997 RepID=UPI000B49DABA|nr:GNAT family N-acetyltransferase [Calothrix rhizosoleniae]
MTLKLPLITSDRLLLSLGQTENIPAILKYYTDNQSYLTPFYPQWHENFFTEQFWQCQLQINLRSFINYKSCKLFIYPQINSHTIIGSINFSNFVWGAAYFCTVGYSLAENKQGQGLMNEALGAAIDYVFKELNMHRIMANYMPHNQRSGKLLKRLGFVVEGYARDYLLINGKWEDHILTSLINHDWHN